MGKSRSLVRNPLTWILVATVAYAIVVAVRPSEAWFGVPGQWTWSGRPPAASTVPRWPPAIAALAGTAAFAVMMDKRWARATRSARALALGGLSLTIPTIQVLLRFIHHRYPIESYLHRTIGPHNGFWQAAISITSLPAYLSAYPEAMRAARGTFVHLTTPPPGSIIYLWVWRQAFAAVPGVAQAIAQTFRAYACADLGFVRLGNAQIATALGQMIVPLLSGLTVVPVYLWASQIGGKRTGWRAAALFALLPTLSLFTMRWDTLYPLFTATAFATLHRGLVTGRSRWWGVAGFVISAAVFFSFGNAILAPAAALYAGLGLWSRERSLRALTGAWRGWLALLAGGISIWAVFQVGTGVSLWQLLAVTGEIQASLRAAYDYPHWLFYNFVDILAMSGFAVTLPFLIETGHAVTKGRDAGPHRPGGLPASLPGLTFAAAILALNLSGLSPGEVARLWLHLTTGMVIMAAIWLRRTPRRGAFAWLVVLLAFQSLWLSLFLRVSETGLPSYAPRTPQRATEAPAALVHFEEGLVLVHAEVSPRAAAPGESVRVPLTWYASRRTDTPYTVFVHLVDDTGALVAQQDAMPLDNTLPTTCWVPGEIIDDAVELELPSSATPGPYRLRIGWYDLRTMERLPLDASEADIFTLPDVVEVR